MALSRELMPLILASAWIGVLEKLTRRKISADYKMRITREAEALHLTKYHSSSINLFAYYKGLLFNKLEYLLQLNQDQ